MFVLSKSSFPVYFFILFSWTSFYLSYNFYISKKINNVELDVNDVDNIVYVVASPKKVTVDVPKPSSFPIIRITNVIIK